LWVLEGGADSIKQALVSLEETHPLGRLWDWDVYPGEFLPLSREKLGLPPRRCFLCERPAKECSRGRIHPDEEIVGFIRRTVRNWENEGEETLGPIG
ncbi:MAG: citrate lyase holo-[acyl-carrier protein] synthase, partial [Bacteroidota bacterium]